MISKLNSKRNNEPGSCFYKPDSILDIHWGLGFGRSSTQFDVDAFIEKTTHPFLRDLIKEIKNAYKIPNHLIGFTASDLVSLSKNATEQAEYGIKEFMICFFLGGGVEPSPLLNIANFGSLVNPIVLKEQYEVFKFHIFKQHLQWEKQQQDGLAGALQQLESQKSQETSLGPLLSKTKLSKF